MKPRYIVVGSKPWNRNVFYEKIINYPGEWLFIGSQEEFSLSEIKKVNPRYLFFLHWSWKLPSELIDTYECVCFHSTDVPYGRGGSPIQNLIVRDHESTKLTALRMTKDFDAGPVYYKSELCLAGNAEEIYIRATYLSAKLIQRIINEQPELTPQSGDIVNFKRRRPEESEIPSANSLQKLYNHIRMLDAEGYPKAFIQHEGFRYEFSRCALYNGRVVADVNIIPIEEEST